MPQSRRPQTSQIKDLRASASAPGRALGKGAAWGGRTCARRLQPYVSTDFSRPPLAMPRSPPPVRRLPCPCPPPRAFILKNLPSEGRNSLYCLYTGPRAYLTREGRGYVRLFLLGCHFARSTPFPPDVSCPSALCLICVTVTLAEIQQPFVSASLWWFLVGWTVGAVGRKGGDVGSLVPLGMGEPTAQLSSSSSLSTPPAGRGHPQAQPRQWLWDGAPVAQGARTDGQAVNQLAPIFSRL